MDTKYRAQQAAIAAENARLQAILSAENDATALAEIDAVILEFNDNQEQQRLRLQRLFTMVSNRKGYRQVQPFWSDSAFHFERLDLALTTMVDPHVKLIGRVEAGRLE